MLSIYVIFISVKSFANSYQLYRNSLKSWWTPLAVQWLGHGLSVPRTRIWSLVRETKIHKFSIAIKKKKCKLHLFKVYTLIHFHLYPHLRNHHHDQVNRYFYHPPKFPPALLFCPPQVRPQATDLLSVTIDYFSCFILWGIDRASCICQFLLSPNLGSSRPNICQIFSSQLAFPLLLGLQ